MAITLLDMLLNSGLINRGQFEEALQNRVLYGGKIGTSLIELGYISEEELARFLGNKLGVPYVNPDQLLHIPTEIIDLLPRELALKYGAIPLSLDKKRLSLVMADPSDLQNIDEISFITGYTIRPLIAPEVRLVQALGIYYQTPVDFRYQQIIDRIEEQRTEILEPLEEVVDQIVTEEEILEEAEIVEKGEWTERINRFAPSKLSMELSRAESREEIADLVIGDLTDRFERAVLFMIRGETAIGWKGVFLRKPLTALNELRIPLGEPSVLKTVADGSGLYLGPLTDTPMNRKLLEGVGDGGPGTVILAPLVISGRIVAILYADGWDNLGEKVPELQKLLAKAALAFEALICREKILML
ncbi:MAG TPA: hypothetical protein VFF53_08165 [Geobacteraceae bacterium]|nr:hypothetical protein [Geobacteraceae bacterium]